MRTFLSSSMLVLLLASASMAHAQINVEVVDVPTNMSLVWEAQSYTPPFYKGKALMADGGDAHITAFLPAGVSADQNITYTWRIDGVVDAAASGINRNVYRFRSPAFGGSPLIVVEAHTNGSLIGVGATRIPLVEPHVLVYGDSPLGGVMFNRTSGLKINDEVTLEAYPYFFSAPYRNSIDLSYRWMIDGLTTNNPLGNSPRIVLRSETARTTRVDVAVSNKENILELTTGKTSIEFQ